MIDNSLKNELTLSMLEDTNTYKKLENNPLENSISFINDQLFKLKENKMIPKEIYNKLIVDNSYKLGSFRILLKIHKSKFGLRPIINCKNNITSKLCLLMELILKPIVVNTETYLQDSQHLIQLCESINNDKNIDLSKDTYLYSCDFESLYSNIDLDLALKLILETLIEQNIIDNFKLTIISIKTILELIFTQNFFTYNNLYFQQIKGIAMGAICGPSIANIVVYKLEIKWLHIHKPLLYRRYIDDINLMSNVEINEKEFQDRN